MLSAIRKSLRAKIVIVVLLTTFAALAVSAVALLIYETRSYGAFLVADATTQAELLADITAPALEFDDAAAATANLELLRRRAGLDAAAVYTADGKLFAKFERSPDAQFPPLGPRGTTIEGRTLTVFHPIVRNDQMLGTVYLRSSYEIAGRLRDHLLILLGVMVPSFLMAMVISFWLAGGVTDPLQTLTDVAQHVVERRDFTRRASRTTDDEVGVFVDAFNTMVAEIGRHAEALESSNRALQEETEERRQAEVALRLADQRKDEFLATLAHELRNPLAPMTNAMTLLESPAADAALVKRAHSIIRRQLAQMVRLVDDLLDVARITSGKLAIRKQPVELAQVVQNAIDTARPVLEERQQTLTVELPKEAVVVQADGVRLAQVFANLLNNAAKYSDRGKEIMLAAAVDASSVRVSVTDQGIGIAPENLTAIFEMFTQGHATQATQSGLGVGLALARRLIELHGGTIWAESSGSGRGSVFTVELPTAVGVHAQRAADLAQPPVASATRRILLVDDNVDFASSMSLLLQRLGHEVRVAHTAAEALAVARELRPEIGFLDLGLPDASGYELAGALRALGEAESPLLVAVSGWGQPRDRERSQQAGFALHLVKPVEIKSIEAAIAMVGKPAP
jgi:signal transduction histidine kinase/ActR/RegA family two-component response regulator